LPVDENRLIKTNKLSRIDISQAANLFLAPQLQLQKTTQVSLVTSETKQKEVPK